MIVKQIWTANAYRNFNYLIACRETGGALAIDPLDYEKCLKPAKAAFRCFCLIAAPSSYAVVEPV